MSRKKYIGIIWIIFVLIALIAYTNVYAVLPPGAAERLKEQASEHLVVEILSTNKRPNNTGLEGFVVEFKAKVIEIKRSEAGLKIGDIIIIESYHITVRFKGPKNPPLLPDGWKGEVFLNQFMDDSKRFKIAAYGHSFITLDSLKNN